MARRSPILSLAADKTDPRILNYLGYSHRKAGRVTVGLGYYQEALRHDPDYTLVREYMGEAYLQQGNVEAAKEQLDRDREALRQGLRGIRAARRADRRLSQGLSLADSRSENRPPFGGRFFATSIRPADPDDLPVALVGQQPDRTVRRDVDVADAAELAFQHAFLAEDLAAFVAVEP